MQTNKGKSVIEMDDCCKTNASVVL